MKLINNLKNQKFKEGLLLGIILSFIFILGFYIGVIYVFSQGQQRFTVFKTDNEGFRFKKGNNNLISILNNGQVKSEGGFCIRDRCIDNWYFPPVEHILETPLRNCTGGCNAESIIHTPYKFCALTSWEFKIYDNTTDRYHDLGKCEVIRENYGGWRIRAVYDSGGERNAGGYVKCKVMCF